MTRNKVKKHLCSLHLPKQRASVPVVKNLQSPYANTDHLHVQNQGKGCVHRNEKYIDKHLDWTKLICTEVVLQQTEKSCILTNS